MSWRKRHVETQNRGRVTCRGQNDEKEEIIYIKMVSTKYRDSEL